MPAIKLIKVRFINQLIDYYIKQKSRPALIQFFLKTQAGWPEKTHIELSKAEEPVGRHWTVEIMG